MEAAMPVYYEYFEENDSPGKFYVNRYARSQGGSYSRETIAEDMDEATAKRVAAILNMSQKYLDDARATCENQGGTWNEG